MHKFYNERKNYVSSFLKEYLTVSSLANATSEMEPDMSLACDYEIKSKVQPFDEDVQEGQIRLLSQTEEITYIAILKQWANNLFVVAPFSHFNAPATDDELKMTFDGGLFLRTLQIWNIRTLHVETLKKTWLVGKMPAKDMADAWQLWRYSLGRTNDISDDIILRTGLPIYKKEDPRLEYEDHCLANFAKLDSEDLETCESEDLETSEEVFDEEKYTFEELFMITMISLFRPAQSVLAAADEKENPFGEYTVYGKNISIIIQYDLDEQKLHVDVYGADGDFTTELDGWSFVDSFNEEIAKIKDGRIRIDIAQDEWNGELALMDSEGNLHKLNQVEN